MLTLLSPAKKLNYDPAATALEATKPRLVKDTKELAKVAKTQTADDLKRLMHISDNLANLNAERFKACLLYTSPSPRDRQKSRMPSSA